MGVQPHPHESPSPNLTSTRLMLACDSSPSSTSRARFLVGASVVDVEAAASGESSAFSIRGAVESA